LKKRLDFDINWYKDYLKELEGEKKGGLKISIGHINGFLNDLFLIKQGIDKIKKEMERK